MGSMRGILGVWTRAHTHIYIYICMREHRALGFVVRIVCCIVGIYRV